MKTLDQKIKEISEDILLIENALPALKLMRDNMHTQIHKMGWCYDYLNEQHEIRLAKLKALQEAFEEENNQKE